MRTYSTSAVVGELASVSASVTAAEARKIERKTAGFCGYDWMIDSIIRDSEILGKLARLLGWHHSTVWRKLNGKCRITQSDELAIRQIAGALFGKSCADSGDL